MATDPLILALIAERERLGLTVNAAARRAGVNPSNIASWEMGIASPKLIGLRKWAAGLGVEIGLVATTTGGQQP